MIKICLIALAAYLLGSVSSSVMLSSLLFRADVRKHGSGNAGATNVARNFGMKAGVATLLCDMLKALVAMGFGLWLGGELGKAVAGIACLLGHFFPVFFEFKGGGRLGGRGGTLSGRGGGGVYRWAALPVCGG